jgi:hypothetical protein
LSSVASGTRSEATTLGANAVASPEADDGGPEASLEALGVGVDELLVALTITMVAMIAMTSATGARAATTGCLERKRFGSVVGCFLARPESARRGRLDGACLDNAEVFGIGLRRAGTRGLVALDISFSWILIGRAERPERRRFESSSKGRGFRPPRDRTARRDPQTGAGVTPDSSVELGELRRAEQWIRRARRKRHDLGAVAAQPHRRDRGDRQGAQHCGQDYRRRWSGRSRAALAADGVSTTRDSVEGRAHRLHNLGRRALRGRQHTMRQEAANDCDGDERRQCDAPPHGHGGKPRAAG